MNIHTRCYLFLLFFLLSSVSNPVWSAGGQERLKLRVDGMHCQSCVSMIRKAVRRVPGINSVSIDLESGVVEAVCDSSGVRSKAVTEAIQRMGYKVVAPDSSTNAHKDSTHTTGH